jgi:hypothetical protein
MRPTLCFLLLLLHVQAWYCPTSNTLDCRDAYEVTATGAVSRYTAADVIVLTDSGTTDNVVRFYYSGVTNGLFPNASVVQFNYAYIQFQGASASYTYQPGMIQIKAESGYATNSQAANNAPTHWITNRNTNSPTVYWSPLSTFQTGTFGGPEQRSADVTALLSFTIAQTGWQNGFAVQLRNANGTTGPLVEALPREVNTSGFYGSLHYEWVYDVPSQTCEALGLTVGSVPFVCVDPQPGTTCTGGQSLCAAQGQCTLVGMRLCTAAELDAGVLGSSITCNLATQRVWSSTSCNATNPTGYATTQAGSPSGLGVAPKQCSSVTANARVICCADSVPALSITSFSPNSKSYSQIQEITLTGVSMTNTTAVQFVKQPSTCSSAISNAGTTVVLDPAVGHGQSASFDTSAFGQPGDTYVLCYAATNSASTWTAISGVFTITLTNAPTENPTDSPTDNPTQSPTSTPTRAPTPSPTQTPTRSPTDTPTTAPPTAAPSSESPTSSPNTQYPTSNPTTLAPSTTSTPSASPTTATPTETPTNVPTDIPTTTPTATPTTVGPVTESPTGFPTTATPTATPTTATPTNAPTPAPTRTALVLVTTNVTFDTVVSPTEFAQIQANISNATMIPSWRIIVVQYGSNTSSVMIAVTNDWQDDPINNQTQDDLMTELLAYLDTLVATGSGIGTSGVVSGYSASTPTSSSIVSQCGGDPLTTPYIATSSCPTSPPTSRSPTKSPTAAAVGKPTPSWILPVAVVGAACVFLLLLFIVCWYRRNHVHMHEVPIASSGGFKDLSTAQYDEDIRLGGQVAATPSLTSTAKLAVYERRAAELPPGWSKQFDPNGIPYFFNADTGESSWYPPSA